MTPRLGLVGTGTMGLKHLGAWRAAGVEPAGVAASRPESAQAFAAEHGLTPFASVDALLAACDAVDLCVPTDLHAPLALRAAERGRDVVCEKPLALNAEQGRGMIDACSRHGVLLLVAQVLRFFPTYRRAAELVRSGALGSLTHVALQRASAVPVGSWYRDVARSGGMALDLLVHDADYACLLLGAPSDVGREVLPVPSAAPEAERLRLHLRWPSGASGVLEGSWSLPEAVTRFRLEGTGGVLVGQGERLTFTSSEQPATPQDVAVEPWPPYERQAQHLAAALRREEPFEVRPEEALLALEVCTRADGA